MRCVCHSFGGTGSRRTWKSVAGLVFCVPAAAEEQIHRVQMPSVNEMVLQDLPLK